MDTINSRMAYETRLAGGANCIWPPDEASDRHISRLFKRREELLKEMPRVWTQ